MADIFISYKREDREWAEALSRALESQGWTTWWDTRLAAGESFDKVIERELDAAKCVIVLWSKRSIESKWVIAEAGEGLEREIIVPVFIENVRPPLVFRRIHTARLIGWKKGTEEAIFVRLVADVSRILGPSPREKETTKVLEEERLAQERERMKEEQAEQERKQVLEEARRKREAEREAERLAREQDERRKESKPATEPSDRTAQEPVTTGKHLGSAKRLVTHGGPLPLRRAFMWSAGVLGLVFTVYLIQLNFNPEIPLPPDSGQLGDQEITRQGIEFVLVKEGSFQMGENDGYPDEKPVHEVRISQPFYLGKYEVTQAQWEAVMSTNPSYFKGSNLPVEKVSWNDVQDFISRLNAKENCVGCYRLPTEAEWECAARAGATTAYSFGNEESQLGAYAWYNGNAGRKTHPVGQKQPNPWDLYDMHGNVWEWVHDWYGEYSAGPITDPKGPETGSDRVVRGGSWGPDPTSLRSAFRYASVPGNRINNIGFRLVRTVQ